MNGNRSCRRRWAKGWRDMEMVKEKWSEEYTVCCERVFGMESQLLSPQGVKQLSHTRKHKHTHLLCSLFQLLYTSSVSCSLFLFPVYEHFFFAVYFPSFFYIPPLPFFNEIGGESRNDGKEEWRKEKRGMGDSPFKCPYAPVCIVQITFPLLG